MSARGAKPGGHRRGGAGRRWRRPPRECAAELEDGNRQLAGDDRVGRVPGLAGSAHLDRPGEPWATQARPSRSRMAWSQWTSLPGTSSASPTSPAAASAAAPMSLHARRRCPRPRPRSGAQSVRSSIRNAMAAGSPGALGRDRSLWSLRSPAALPPDPRSPPGGASCFASMVGSRVPGLRIEGNGRATV